jgi:hypothetical protein
MHCSCNSAAPLTMAHGSWLQRQRPGYVLAPWPRPSGLPSVGWEPWKAVSRHSFGAGLLYSARTYPDPCRQIERVAKPFQPEGLFYLQPALSAAEGGGYLAEHKRRTPKEWSKTAKRFKACDRLRAARRAAAVQRGNPRPAPRMEQQRSHRKSQDIPGPLTPKAEPDC